MFEPCVNRKQQTEKLKSFVFEMETMTMFDLFKTIEEKIP